MENFIGNKLIFFLISLIVGGSNKYHMFWIRIRKIDKPLNISVLLFIKWGILYGHVNVTINVLYLFHY